MNKKLIYLGGMVSLTLSLLVAAFTISAGSDWMLALRANDNNTWVHYTKRDPSYTDYGIKEYWVSCDSHTYQFTAPATVNITEGGSDPDTSEFLHDDSRWNKKLIPYAFSQNDRSTVVGAMAYNLSSGEDQTWWGASNACLQVLGVDSLKYKQYDLRNFIEYFPRINFEHYKEVTMDITLNIWKSSGGGVKLGFTEAAYSEGPLLATSSGDGTLTFISNGSSVTATLTYQGNTVLSETINNHDIVCGHDSMKLYITGTTTGDFYMTIRNFSLTAFEHPKLNLGVWNGSYHFTHDQQLIDIANQGVNVIVGVNPYWMSQSTWLHVLDLAESLGVKFIVDPRQYNSSIGNYDIWDGTKPYYADHDAVMGFDIWDEPSTQKFDTIASLKAQFDAVMPEGKIFFVNLLSSLCGLDGLYGTATGKTSSSQFYETNYAGVYHNTVGPDIYSWDSYPLFDNGKIRRTYFCDFDIWSYVSKNNDIPLWYTLLAAAHNSGDGLRYLVPTAKELRWQMSVAMTYGISSMLDYIYATTDDTYVCMANLEGGQITSYSDIFYDMGTVNGEFRVWEELYLSYEWQGVGTVKSGAINYLFNDLRHTISLTNYGISSISSTADLLVGAFKDYGNNNAYMITNAGKSTTYGNYAANVPYTNTDGTVTIHFPSTISGVKIIKNGVTTYQTVNDTSLSLNIDAYGSMFIIPII